jgi:hypothetical protein
VWNNFDEITGVSFLPMDGGTYRQAPYESMTEFEYHAMVASMPLGIDWDKLVEGTDNVEGAQTLACTAGACEI